MNYFEEKLEMLTNEVERLQREIDGIKHVAMKCNKRDDDIFKKPEKINEKDMDLYDIFEYHTSVETVDLAIKKTDREKFDSYYITCGRLYLFKENEPFYTGIFLLDDRITDDCKNALIKFLNVPEHDIYKEDNEMESANN